MKTSYGLEFEVTDGISPEWSEYDKSVAKAHMLNYNGRIVVGKDGRPIDNEYDLVEIEAEAGLV